MKSRIITLCSCLALGIGLTTITQSNVSPSDISLTNIAALQSSGDEVYCDQRDQTICVIRIGDVRGVSTGSPRSN